MLVSILNYSPDCSLDLSSHLSINLALVGTLAWNLVLIDFCLDSDSGLEFCPGSGFYSSLESDLGSCLDFRLN